MRGNLCVKMRLALWVSSLGTLCVVNSVCLGVRVRVNVNVGK
jgi:hypothetical protein